MNRKDFFLRRYAQLGWAFEDVKPRAAIRINRSHTKDPRTIAERIRSLGIEIEKIPFLTDGFWVNRSPFSVGATSEYLLGLYSIQEAAAQIPATLFTGVHDKILLDACAAPGGKTVQLADLMDNSGAIVALDVKKQRLQALANQLERCRVHNSLVYLLDARRVSKLRISFDAALLDMPCSGNFAGDPKWFRRRTMDDVRRNAALQREILTEVVRSVREGGEIVYSTCSLEPEEDELNIDWALKNLNVEIEEIKTYGSEGLIDVFGVRLDSSVRRCRRMWPELTQGFFVCKFRKVEAA